mmetsp:Transcript_50899/g.111488  ORF Transcript_50899/g.111488 Transcript_50899/m.111488 type:complete len:468 (-) Transcript_50899:98-1501(-)
MVLLAIGLQFIDRVAHVLEVLLKITEVRVHLHQIGINAIDGVLQLGLLGQEISLLLRGFLDLIVTPALVGSLSLLFGLQAEDHLLQHLLHLLKRALRLLQLADSSHQRCQVTGTKPLLNTLEQRYTLVHSVRDLGVVSADLTRLQQVGGRRLANTSSLLQNLNCGLHGLHLLRTSLGPLLPLLRPCLAGCGGGRQGLLIISQCGVGVRDGPLGVSKLPLGGGLDACLLVLGRGGRLDGLGLGLLGQVIRILGVNLALLRLELLALKLMLQLFQELNCLVTLELVFLGFRNIRLGKQSNCLLLLLGGHDVTQDGQNIPGLQHSSVALDLRLAILQGRDGLIDSCDSVINLRLLIQIRLIVLTSLRLRLILRCGAVGDLALQNLNLLNHLIDSCILGLLSLLQLLQLRLGLGDLILQILQTTLAPPRELGVSNFLLLSFFQRLLLQILDKSDHLFDRVFARRNNNRSTN